MYETNRIYENRIQATIERETQRIALHDLKLIKNYCQISAICRYEVKDDKQHLYIAFEDKKLDIIIDIDASIDAISEKIKPHLMTFCSEDWKFAHMDYS